MSTLAPKVGSKEHILPMEKSLMLLERSVMIPSQGIPDPLLA